MSPVARGNNRPARRGIRLAHGNRGPRACRPRPRPRVGRGPRLQRRAPAAPRPRRATATKILAPLWVGPAFSGSWYTPSRPGEGFTLQILDNGTRARRVVHLSARGQPGAPGVDHRAGRARSRATAFASRRSSPRAVRASARSTIRRSSRCFRGARSSSASPTATTASSPTRVRRAGASGTRAMTRLTALSELECAGKRRLTASGARALAGLRQRSGALFDPAHNGEGWQFEELPDGTRAGLLVHLRRERRAGVDHRASSDVSGERVVVAQNLQPVGHALRRRLRSRAGAAHALGQLHDRFRGLRSRHGARTSRRSPRSAAARCARCASRSSRARRASRARRRCRRTVPGAQGARMPAPESEVAAATIGDALVHRGRFRGAAHLPVLRRRRQHLGERWPRCPTAATMRSPSRIARRDVRDRRQPRRRRSVGERLALRRGGESLGGRARSCPTWCRARPTMLDGYRVLRRHRRRPRPVRPAHARLAAHRAPTAAAGATMRRWSHSRARCG